MQGWIQLHRKISDNPLWTCEAFSRGQAWVDLLLLASHEGSYFYIRGIKVTLEIGQLAWGEPKLAARWKWSRTKLRNFLKQLEKEQQIRQQKSNVIQIITILNYAEYQKKEQQTRQQKNSRKTTEEQQKDTYNNVNNVNNENNVKLNGHAHAEINYQGIIDYYNQKCTKLPKAEKLTTKRIGLINARMKEYDRTKIGEVIQKVSKSNFLNGNNDRNWRADFDWLMSASKFLRVIEGNYDDVDASTPAPAKRPGQIENEFPTPDRKA